MNSERFKGTGVALVTPFTEEGALDEPTFRKLVERQIDGGVDYLVPCGTTGENPTLSFEEHLRVIELTIEVSNGRVPVLAGAGSNATDKAIEFSLEAIDLGADGLLTITPYYNKPSQDGLRRHFGAQAEAVDKKKSGVPLIVYNVPGRTGCNLAAATVLGLSRDLPNVIGVKEASANLDQIQEILRSRDEGFLVISGDDAWTLPIIALGADGVISVAANEIPRLMSSMVRSALDGDFARAREIHFRILPLMTGNFIESNPAPAKAVLSMLGELPSETVRSPLVTISDESRRRLREIIDECGLPEEEKP